jgi:hypothetical protein
VLHGENVDQDLASTATALVSKGFMSVNALGANATGFGTASEVGIGDAATTP